MKTYLFLLLFVFQAFSLSSQISLKGYNQEKIDPSLFEGRWKARWISYGSPDKPGGLSIQLCKSEKKEFYIRYSS